MLHPDGAQLVFTALPRPKARVPLCPRGLQGTGEAGSVSTGAGTTSQDGRTEDAIPREPVAGLHPPDLPRYELWRMRCGSADLGPPWKTL